MKTFFTKGILSCLVVFTLVFSCVALVACESNTNSNSKNNDASVSKSQSESSKSDKQGKSNAVEETRTIGQITKAKIIKITDGDTIYVDAYNKRIRLIGIDCPEKGTAAGETATAYTTSLIPLGSTVWLEKDVSETDKYDRPLRYVWLENPPIQVTKKDLAEKSLNGKLITSGNAKAAKYKPDTKYADWFESI